MADVQIPQSLRPLLERVSAESTAVPPLQATRVFDAEQTKVIEQYLSQQTTARPCLAAALHLVNDDIDRAHKIAQDDEDDMTSNLCHAILHRREGDFWNSKWWLRQIEHPLIKDVYGDTRKAQEFVDAVEAIVKGKKGASTVCAAGNLDRLKRMQADELRQLVLYALRSSSEDGV